MTSHQPCERCQEPLPSEANYCPRCGHPVAEPAPKSQPATSFREKTDVK